MSMTWTDAILKKMKTYYEKGLSSSEIGAKLGLSKNAVIGKINRLGWNCDKKKTIKPAAKKNPVSRNTKEEKSKTNSKPIKKVAGVVKVSKKEDSDTKNTKDKKVSQKELSILHALELAKLAPDQCRWPVGDPNSKNFHFCGEKVFQGKPYCFKHCVSAYSLNKPSDLKKRGA